MGYVEKILYKNVNSGQPACIDQLLRLEKPLIKFVWPKWWCAEKFSLYNAGSMEFGVIQFDKSVSRIYIG